MFKKLFSYIQLTKPSIMLLVLFTGGTALVVEGAVLSRPFDVLLILLGLYLTGGGANALNQCFERDLDAQMERTRKKRPLPLGKLTTVEAFVFSTTISIAGVLLFGLLFNWLSALIVFSTILFYSLFYTLWLKPNTPQNIVIGGIAGSMAPIIAWAAVTGSISLTPVILFLIVFFWTPPHFWALALYYKDDYKLLKMPMMPVIKGDDSTLSQMLLYSFLLFGVTLLLIFTDFGMIYFVIAVTSGAVFVWKCFVTKRLKTRKSYIGFFKYSILHLFLLFTIIIINGLTS